MSDMNVGVSHVMYHHFFGKGMIVMSDIAYDWIALGVAAILFVILAFLKRKKNAGFTTRVLLATAFGIILGIAFNGHTDYVGAVGSIWSNAITALVVPLLLFSIISSITNLGESIRLKSIGAKTVFFLLLNTDEVESNPLLQVFFPAGVVAFTSENSIGTIPVTVRQLRSAGIPGDIASFVAGTEPSQRANITNDAKSDSANVSHQQSGFALNFAPNAMFSASGDDACCGTKPNK